MEAQKTPDWQSNPEWNSGGITFLDWKLYYRVIVLKTALVWYKIKIKTKIKTWYWYKNGPFSKGAKIKDVTVSACNCSWLTFGKSAKNEHWRKYLNKRLNLLNKWCWGTICTYVEWCFFHFYNFSGKSTPNEQKIPMWTWKF